VSRIARAALALLLLAACTNANSEERVLNVFAAASLTEAFGAIAGKFEKSHENVDVRLNLLSSSELATQIEQGAPADVFASADMKNMERLDAEGLLSSTPEIFATNAMTIVVESGNPLNISDVADLADPSLVISIAAPGVPAGDYTRAVSKKSGVEISADSEEQDVRAVVTRVATGEADAGIVYESDAETTSEVDSVAIPRGVNVIARYPVAVPAQSNDKVLARSFMSLVLSSDGLASLIDHGFDPP
jgi:molybdate transport system substrate-binding protein